MSDIVDEMKNWRDERGYPTPGEMLDRAIAEITRLRAEVERLRLTDAERKAVWSAIEHGEDATVSGLPPLWTSALRQLLARLGGER